MSKRDLIKKGIDYLKYYGVKELARKTEERLIPEPFPYSQWYPKHLMSQGEMKESKEYEFNLSPVISVIVPAFETEPKYLIQLIKSMQDQLYGKFQLCIADGSESSRVMDTVSPFLSDSRITYKKLENNLGISGNTNAGLAMATGDYIGFLDHDDFLEPDALLEIVRAINEKPDTELIYTDEDKSDSEGLCFNHPQFKPDFNIGLLRSNNYICHFLVVKKELRERVGGFEKSFDGAQDYDFILRCIENTDKILHIPRVLYHWRMYDDSTSSNSTSKMYAFEAGRKALAAHLSRIGVDAEVHHAQDLGYYRTTYTLNSEPKVSVIITTAGDNMSLVKCVDSVRKAEYGDYEFFVIKDRSDEINDCVRNQAGGEYIILLNEELIISDGTDWIKELVSQCSADNVGLVGVKLLTPSGRLFNRKFPMKSVYHAGMILGLGGFVGNAFKGLPGNLMGYMHRASIIGDCSMVSSLMYIVRKDTFLQEGGLDDAMAPGLAGPDLCLRLLEKGKRIVYDPYVVASYYGRGARINPEDRKIMRERWAKAIEAGDRFYNPNFSYESPGYIIDTN